MSIFLGLLLIGGLLGSLYLYVTLRTFVAESKLPFFPAVATTDTLAPEPEQPAQQQPADPVNPQAEDQPPAVGVKPEAPVASLEEAVPPPTVERLTLLLMGIDRRENEEGPWRTDTMILLSLDPESDSIAMLSVPRDLYVTIPDYGYGEHLDRINTAFVHGEINDYPGGGAALAKQTIRRNFGIDVDRYVVMDFDGFRSIIDYIGGIEIDVPERLVDRQYPTEDYGYMTVRFEEGPQLMDGESALIYSRSRKSTSDFARAERQQQVIMAVRDKVLSLDIIPSLTPHNLARIVTTMNDSVETDLTLDEVIALGKAAQEIDDEDIHRVVIDSTMVRAYINEYGAEVLLPRWSTVLAIVEETFGIELLPIRSAPSFVEPSYSPSTENADTTG